MADIIRLTPDHRTMVHLTMIATHFAMEIEIFRRNHPDATPDAVAARMATYHDHSVAELRARFNTVKAFIELFDEAVNNPSSGRAKNG